MLSFLQSTINIQPKWSQNAFSLFYYSRKKLIVWWHDKERKRRGRRYSEERIFIYDLLSDIERKCMKIGCRWISMCDQYLPSLSFEMIQNNLWFVFLSINTFSSFKVCISSFQLKESFTQNISKKKYLLVYYKILNLFEDVFSSSMGEFY